MCLFTVYTYLCHCRRAIEFVESQSHSSTPSHPHKSPRPHTPSPHLHNDTPLCVKLPHIASVISAVYSNSTVTLSHSNTHTLPLQQKLAIATLLLCVRGKTVKEVVLGKLQDAYSRVCCHWQLKQEGQTEFVGLCQVLEARGLLSVKKAKETRLTKVSSVCAFIICVLTSSLPAFKRRYVHILLAIMLILPHES